MAAVDIRDNLLGISWVDSSWIPILNSGSVLDYFSERSNPFYDRTCNNEVVKMQRLTLEHLNQMVGVEYILLHAQEPILFIIRKQQRQSPTQVDQTKKEAEPPPETVKSEEKETTKNVQQTVSTKGPPEKRMRLQ
uniref:Mediator of RNA polymerase II transcription subunit 6 n=1 Tax=Equus caballus TaxID=9796 RepID=A0A9L0SM51_HORSE